MHWLVRSSSFSKAQGLRETGSSIVITLFSKMTAILTFFVLRFQLNTLKNNSKVENSNSDKYSILAKRLLWTNIRVHYKCISCRLPSSSVQWDSRWRAAGTWWVPPAHLPSGGRAMILSQQKMRSLRSLREHASVFNVILMRPAAIMSHHITDVWMTERCSVAACVCCLVLAQLIILFLHQ